LAARNSATRSVALSLQSPKPRAQRVGGRERHDRRLRQLDAGVADPAVQQPREDAVDGGARRGAQQIGRHGHGRGELGLDQRAVVGGDRGPARAGGHADHRVRHPVDRRAGSVVIVRREVAQIVGDGGAPAGDLGGRLPGDRRAAADDRDLARGRARDRDDLARHRHAALRANPVHRARRQQRLAIAEDELLLDHRADRQPRQRRGEVAAIGEHRRRLVDRRRVVDERRIELGHRAVGVDHSRADRRLVLIERLPVEADRAPIVGAARRDHREHRAVALLQPAALVEAERDVVAQHRHVVAGGLRGARLGQQLGGGSGEGGLVERTGGDEPRGRGEDQTHETDLTHGADDTPVGPIMETPGRGRRAGARLGKVARMSDDVEITEAPLIHPTAVVERGAQIGAGTRIWHFAHVMPGAVVGADCVVGHACYVGNVTIGDRCRIQNHVSVFDGVTLEDEVLLGPSCVFTNVKHPRAHVSRKEEFAPTRVGRGATIGANATVVCGVTIGAYAFIGAGAAVASDVAPHALVVGVPARWIGWACRCGERLPGFASGVATCARCGDRYKSVGAGIELAA
jgi:UDP-2-acetamido-3-amino-2,3-dideoxy-glucuronate N-acetyltransferase